jgi:uncharacterized protein YgbK (DUF1537 family)
MIMGVVADDITGANDIGGMFAKADYVVHIYPYDGPGALARGRGPAPEPHIAILDTNSRLDDRATAYAKVHAATQELQAAGCRQFHKKTCSVFRGNIGAEFDAMLDALGQDFAVVVLGFPKNGRLTLDGIHYVHGQRLEDSEFRNDPIHPTRRSDLVGILQAQTQRKVGLVSQAVIAQGAAAVRAHIEGLRAQLNYVICDVPSQDGLRTIAQAAHDFPVLCGSSALAEELPAVWPAVPRAAARPALARHPGTGVLCVAGSLMPQTARQIEHLRARGLTTITLDTPCLADPPARAVEIDRVTVALTATLTTGQDAVLHSPHDPATVAATRAAGEAQDLTPTATARLVTEALADVTARVLAATGQNRLVVAGGETSAAVTTRLGITGVMVWQELEPGLPSCISLSNEPLLLVLKSGSFGSPTFLQQALEHVRSQ